MLQYMLQFLAPFHWLPIPDSLHLEHLLKVRMSRFLKALVSNEFFQYTIFQKEGESYGPEYQNSDNMYQQSPY